MEKTFIKGKTDEEKWASVDTTFRQLIRKMGGRSVAITPPIPLLFNYALPEEDGTLFECIIPFACNVPLVYFCIRKYNQKEVKITVSMETDKATSNVDVMISKKIHVYKLDWALDAGTIVSAKVTPANGIEKFLVSILIYPSLSIVEKEFFIREQLLTQENLIEKAL